MKWILLLLFFVPQQICAQRAGLLVNCNFDNGIIPPALNVQKCCGYSQVFESDTTRFGIGKALRFHLNFTDSFVFGGKRSELSSIPIVGNERWIGYSTYIPHSFVADTIRDLITQFHNVIPDSVGKGTYPPITLKIENDHYYIQVRWDTVSAGLHLDGEIIRNLGPVIKDVWTDWVWHVRFSLESDGIIELWRNGVQIFRHLGPNRFNDGQYPYFKCGSYKAGWDFRSHTQGILSREIYFDELRIGGSHANYNTVVPGIDAPSIRYFTPATAGIGDTVTIFGSTFTAASAVNFGGVPAASFSIDSTLSIIKAVVTTGASGTVTVTTPGGTASKDSFTFAPPAIIISGKTSLCLGGPGAFVTFKGVHGIPPYTFIYTLNNGPQQTITTNIPGNTVMLPISADSTAQYTYRVLSVVDNNNTHVQLKDVSLTIGVGTPDTSNTALTICSTELPFEWNGIICPGPGTYRAQLDRAGGCDSLARLVLKVNNTTASTTVASVCSTDLPYTWNDGTYNKTGTYTVHLTNAAGCDSAATLELTVNKPTASTTQITVCANDLPFVWNEDSFVHAGTYVRHLTGSAGCDSAATLVLTINKPSASTTLLSIPSSALPYKWNAAQYAKAGTYTQHLANKAGCDSAATLQLRTTGALNVSVRPNPAAAQFTLEVLGGESSEQVQIRVMDIAGRTVYRTKGTIYDTYNFGGSFINGIYIIEVLNGDNTQRIKVIKVN